METTLYHPILIRPGKDISYTKVGVYQSRGIARQVLNSISLGKAAIYDTATGKLLAFKNNKDRSGGK